MHIFNKLFNPESRRFAFRFLVYIFCYNYSIVLSRFCNGHLIVNSILYNNNSLLMNFADPILHFFNLSILSLIPFLIPALGWLVGWSSPLFSSFSFFSAVWWRRPMCWARSRYGNTVVSNLLNTIIVITVEKYRKPVTLQSNFDKESGLLGTVGYTYRRTVLYRTMSGK